MGDARTVELDERDLRAVARYAARCAETALAIFEAHSPRDRRPRQAIEAAWQFVGGAPRSKVQRVAALAAHRAAAETTSPAARDAARAAGHAAAAAYLHPLARATQVRHILGAAAHATRALELANPGDDTVARRHLANLKRRASHNVIALLRRYPAAPATGNRVAQLMKTLDTALRGR